MLSFLSIDNIAVIEHCEVEFKEGLNILTGETGAGKSMVIDAINAIRGERMTKDIIRYGANVAKVVAIFTPPFLDCSDILQEYGIAPQDDSSILIQREVHSTAKSICRVNSCVVSTVVLKALANRLITVHGQYDNHALLNPNQHINYIDKVGSLENKLESYKNDFYKALELKKNLDRVKEKSKKSEQEIEFLKYQIDEITNASIVVGEKKELLERKKRFNDSQKIVKSLNLCDVIFDGEEQSFGIFEQLGQLSNEIENLKQYSSNIDNLNSDIENIIYSLQDVQTMISKNFADSNYTNDDIELIESRLDELHRLCLKYGESEEEILNYLEKITKEYSEYENSNELIEELKNDYLVAVTKAKKQAEILSEARKGEAQKFTQRVKEELSFLDMPKIELVAQFEKCNLTSNGCDSMQFLISANAGENPKPISKIASGGELSRIMLAIKNVIAEKDEINTLIFDEVDSGISGRAAQKVGKKLQEIATNKQIICVTHLAQVAAHSDVHFLIEKHSMQSKTFTNIKELNQEGKVSELSRIMNGASITQSQLQSAKELIEYCKR